MQKVKGLGEPVLNVGQTFANEIEVGDYAKIMLVGVLGMKGRTERVWVKVTGKVEKGPGENTYKGVLDNEPVMFSIERGTDIEFADRNVFAVMGPNPLEGKVVH